MATTTVCISVGRCSSQLQCQKIKMDYSSGSMLVAGMKMAGRLPIHKGTSSMVSTKYRKMKIGMNMMIGDLQMQQEHAARHSSTLCQPKQKHHARHYSTSEEIISQINKDDTSQLSELVDALKADDADTFVSVVKSIHNEHNKLPPDAIIQGIRISGDTLIHIAARHKAEETLNLIFHACPPLLTAQNLVGDTVWHVVATEGLDHLFRQLCAFRQEQLSTPTTYKAGKNNGQHLRLNSLNIEGNTALHASLISRNESIAYALFEMIPDRECQYYFSPNKEGKSAIYLAAEAGYVNLLRQMMKFVAAHPGILSETPKRKSIIHAVIAGKHLVPKKVAADQFASLSTANTSETTSVGVSPQQYPVPPPQSELDSPLFWVGVGVGLSALSSWEAELKASGILIQDTSTE